MRYEFSGEMWWWRGPSPFHFVTVQSDIAREIATLSPLLSYGWGVIPVRSMVGTTEFTTSLFPKDGGYALPVKTEVRRRERLEIGDVLHVVLFISPNN